MRNVQELSDLQNVVIDQLMDNKGVISHLITFNSFKA